MNLYELAVAKALSGSGGGGGGGNGPVLLASKSLGHVTSSSSTETAVDTSISFSDVNDWDYNVLFVIVSTNDRAGGETDICHVSTVSVILKSKNTDRALLGGGSNTKYLKTTQSYQQRPNTSKHGIYPKSANISSAGVLTLPTYVAWSSTYTGVIDGDYTMNIYGLNITDLLI